MIEKLLSELRKNYLSMAKGDGSEEPEVVILSPDLHEEFVSYAAKRCSQEPATWLMRPDPSRPMKFLNCLFLKSETLGPKRFVMCMKHRRVTIS